MRYLYFENYLGDQVRVPCDDTGQYCPICGTSFGGFEVFYGDREPADEICPGCNTHFGNGDVPRQTDPVMTTEQYYQRIRIQWLNKYNWNESLLKQLREILGIDTDELRAIASK
jgi:hypothetical protein